MMELFSVVYADPPWRYDFSRSASRKIENHYPTMMLSEIKQFDIPAADDAVLFLWATNPKLPEALQVIGAWGFSYRTNIVWVKPQIGMGYYARSAHELLLIGKRGNLPVPAPASRPRSWLLAPRQKHSAKPHAFYELIESMYPGLSYLEMFARNSRPGWHSMGNEMETA